MGRPAASRRTTNRGAGVVDRSADGGLCPDHGAGGTPSLGPTRAGPVLPAPRPAPQEVPPTETLAPGQAVTLQHLWFQLPVPERQRFGHCFSAMLLKALGLRPAPTQEVKP
jgi:hypothetical protein